MTEPAPNSHIDPSGQLPAVIYAAKSTEDRHGSIPDQIADGRKLAAARGFDIVAEHQDENASAFHGNRGPGLAAAMAECERQAAEHGSCALVVQHSDRLARGNAREARHLIEVVLWAIKADVQLISVQDPEMLAGGDMALLLGAIGGMRNHEDSRRKSLSVRDGLRRRLQVGKPVGGPPPYGYRREDTRLVLHQHEASIVCQMFELADAGMSQRAISRKLAAEGIPGLAQSSVGRTLGNPVYAGRLRVKGEIIDGRHEAIVDPDLWDRVNASRATPQRRAGGRPPKGQHLLTRGLLRCPCGCAMIPRVDAEGRQSYVCRGRRMLGTGCTQSAIRRETIDSAILAELTSRFLDLDETRRRIEARQHDDLALAREALAEAEREAQRAQDRVTRVQRDYQDGKLTVDDWNEMRPDLMSSRDAARAAVEQAQARIEGIEQAGPRRDAEEDLLRHLADLKAAVAGSVERAPDLAALRTVLGQLFERVELADREHPFPSNQPREGVLDLHGGSDDDPAPSYWLWITVRREAYDFDARRPRRTVLPDGSTDQDTLESESVVLSAMFAPIPVAEVSR